MAMCVGTSVLDLVRLRNSGNIWLFILDWLVFDAIWNILLLLQLATGPVLVDGILALEVQSDVSARYATLIQFLVLGRHGRA